MGFISKLKELFGTESGQNSRAGAGSGADITVEREAGVSSETDAESDTATGSEEAAADPVASGTDASASTESLVDESVKEGEKEQSSERAEPAETVASAAQDESVDVEADEDDVAAVSDSEAGEGGESTDVLKGIGPAYAEKLADAGVDTVSDLADADPESLAAETGVSESRLGRWIDRAKSRS